MLQNTFTSLYLFTRQQCWKSLTLSLCKEVPMAIPPISLISLPLRSTVFKPYIKKKFIDMVSHNFCAELRKLTIRLKIDLPINSQLSSPIRFELRSSFSRTLRKESFRLSKASFQYLQHHPRLRIPANDRLLYQLDHREHSQRESKSVKSSM